MNPTITAFESSPDEGQGLATELADVAVCANIGAH